MSRTDPRARGNTNPIATARMAIGLTQRQLADRLGVSLRSVIRWEREDVTPDAATLFKLAALLNVDPKELL